MPPGFVVKKKLHHKSQSGTSPFKSPKKNNQVSQESQTTDQDQKIAAYQTVGRQTASHHRNNAFMSNSLIPSVQKSPVAHQRAKAKGTPLIESPFAEKLKYVEMIEDRIKLVD